MCFMLNIIIISKFLLYFIKIIHPSVFKIGKQYCEREKGEEREERGKKREERKE